MIENKLEPKRIGELFGHSFYVESYQRGYRWGKAEIIALLEDINDFAIKVNKSESEAYWLQPIIVKQVIKEIGSEKIQCYELIDGQQRLTTIYLIYSFLTGEKSFNIYYNTRTSSLDFLNKISSFRTITWEDAFEKTNDDKIDNFHFFSAYKIIQKWFTDESKIDKEIFLKTIIELTNVIWYELFGGDDLLPKTIFEQINIGKIPLTNAELVKALYLNCYTDKMRKNEIADKWDRIEYALQDHLFWAFISNDINHTHNRIEYLLNLISGKFNNDNNREEKLHTFLYFYKEDNKDAQWKKVEEYFQTLLGWYNTSELYHYVGFLIAVNFFNINWLMQHYNSEGKKPKSKFIETVKSLIKIKMQGYNLEDLSYDKPNDYKKIIHVLLLFNIQTTIDTTPYNYFPFNELKSNRWSLEHIHAQQSKNLIEPDAINEWIKEVKPVVESLIGDVQKGEEAKHLLEGFENTLKQGKNIKVGDLPARVFDFFSDSKDDVHSLSNLALLDKVTNSYLNNSVFPVKREKIFKAERVKQAYIPICTKNVFLKYYSKDISHMQFWSKTDKDNYLESIYLCLEPFIPNM